MSNKNQKERWPHWAFPSKRAWLRDVRKRWVVLRKAHNEAQYGCAFYPTGTMDCDAFKEADKKMKAFYKNA